jgi:hypothetical protein
MMRHRSRFFLGAILLLIIGRLLMPSHAQLSDKMPSNKANGGQDVEIANDGEIVGAPWTGEMGIAETVNEIMARQRRAVTEVEPESIEAEPYGRLHHADIPQNPNSPQIARWPIQAGGAPTGQSFTPQTVGTNFLTAQSVESVFHPPDTEGDVSPTQMLIIVNGRIKLFDKTGNLGALNATTDNFFASVLDGTSAVDPRVRFDRLAGRWFVTSITEATPNRILIAVSKTATITNTSSFTFFQFQQDKVGQTPNSDTGDFADYETLGIDNNALYIGANIFGNNTFSTTGFVVRKSSVLGSGPIVVTPFRQLANGSGSGLYTPQGVNNDDPAATEGYFIGVDNATFGKLDIKRVSNPGGTPTLSATISITTPTTTNPISVPAMGSTTPLDAIDYRLFYARMHNGSLWTAHNIQVDANGVASDSGGRNGARFYEIINLTGTPILNQAGTLFDSAAANPRNFWMPSCAMSGQGHMALGSSVANHNEHPEVTVAGRLAGDPLGTIQAPTTAVTSSSNYNVDSGGAQRWGDYSVTVVDPADDMTIWTFQEFCNTTNSWATQAIKLIAPPPATPASCSPASLDLGAHTTVVVTGTAVNGSGFFDPDASFPNHISASVSSPDVTINSVSYSDPTHISINLTVAPNATPGTFTVTVTNPDGQAVTSASAIFTISNVACPTIMVSPSSLPDAMLGSPYNQLITASGSSGAYTFSISAGALPTGLTLSSNGSLAGTPTMGGTFNFTITATDSNGCSGSQAYSIMSICPAISLAPAMLPTGAEGVAYSQMITASGGAGPYNFSLTSGTLPTGLTLSTAGLLSGTPKMAGNFNITVAAADSVNCSGSQAYTLSIACPTVTITKTTLPNGTKGVGYNQTITVSGGRTPYSFSITSGSLPTGLNLGSSTGAITGMPSSVGTFNFVVMAADADGCSASQALSITVLPAQAPVVSSFSPSSGLAGDTVTINGVNFTGATAVRIGGVSANFNFIADTQITATVPATASTGLISVTTAKGTGNSAASFTVIKPPTITSFSPISGLVGANVNINGTNLSSVTAVQFNGVSAVFTLKTAASLTAVVPAGAASGAITVTNPAGSATSTAIFKVLPQIISFSPGSGLPGASITINGTNFTGVTAVKFSNVSANFTFNSDSQVTATVPATANSGMISLTTPSGTANSATMFTVIKPPTVTSFTPISGPAGIKVTVNGANLSSVTSVQFNGVSAAFTVVSATSLAANAPVGATTGKISVTNPASSASSAANFTFIAGIGSFSPASAPEGATVIITGTGFSGATAVKFGSVAATNFSVDSDNQITATVPVGATTGRITVTTATTTLTSASSFGVAPTITDFSPTSGSAGASVTITGTSFTGVSSVKFNGKAASFTVISSTSLKATVPSGATSGSITATTAGGVATSQNIFMVTP